MPGSAHIPVRGLALVLLFASACVIDAEHVKTKLVKVCTENVPLLLTAQSSELTIATVEVDGVGATVDHPDARASFESMTIEALSGVSDFTFADSLSLDFIASDAALPPARVADVEADRGGSPWVAEGDSSIDLVAYLTSERLEMRLAIVGVPPADSFSVTFSACLNVDGITIED